MHAKRNITRFCTGDVNVALLDQDTAAGLTNGKIFINELLDREKFRTFLNIKYLAQKLGFKYTWHRQGNILVKRRDGDKSHVVSTPADLQVIYTSYVRNCKDHSQSALLTETVTNAPKSPTVKNIASASD